MRKSTGQNATQTLAEYAAAIEYEALPATLVALIKQCVLGSDFDAPQGRVSVSAATSHTNLWSRVGRVDLRGQFEIMQQSAMPVWADPFLVGRGAVSALAVGL